MGKEHQRLLFLLFILPVFFVSFFSCDEAMRITSRCQLTAYVKFYNDSIPNLTVTYLDSTNWDTLKHNLESQNFSHEDSIILIPGNTEYLDTLTITWDFEHHDVYSEEGAVCSALVDLNLVALVSQSDSVFRTIDLGLFCSSLFLDTTYVDTTADLYINTFTVNKVFFIP